MKIKLLSSLVVAALSAPGCLDQPEEAKTGSLEQAVSSPLGNPLDAQGPPAPREKLPSVEAGNPAASRALEQAAVPDTMGGGEACEERAKAPDLCEWIAMADATVLVRVKRLMMLQDLVRGIPVGATELQGEWLEANRCSGVAGGLAMDVEVVDTLYGDTDPEVRVRVGWEQQDRFVPSARSDGKPLDGVTGATGVDWKKPHAGWMAQHPHRGPLGEGQLVLMGISQVAIERGGAVETYWSLMGNTIIGVDAADVVHVFERNEDCQFNLAPRRLDGLTVAAASALAAECGRNALAAGRALGAKLRAEWQSPLESVSAWCTDEVHQSPRFLSDSNRVDVLPDTEVIGWGTYVDPVSGKRTRVTEQTKSTATGVMTVKRLD